MQLTTRSESEDEEYLEREEYDEGGLAPGQPDLDNQRQKLIHDIFPLPHRDYPHEAHDGHVYTIQLIGKWLVSGSADNTIRVWDLETRRLRGEPLVGHTQSVTCLQFDPSENEDVIISGSVDASIIVWRFSTGQLLKIIPSAHDESILSLRFNQSYLFTGSKDKSVKMWSRQELSPLNQNYPRAQNGPKTTIPSYVVDFTSTEPPLIEAGLANGSIRPLEPYTHVATFQGHHAAVNAIDIHDDLLISGSGDRVMCVWNTKTGEHVRQITGPSKGVACLQTDGKRIVSGSSDNSVRINDLDTGAEEAVLPGHVNLVRTLQADFQGVLSPALDKNNPQSARQQFEDGSKLNRIVSGSYDESIIIWKKRDTDGRWSREYTYRLEPLDAAFSHDDRGAQVPSIDYSQRLDRSRQDSIQRVFKVQFDAKRLVCCSQDSRIYCWQFFPD